MLLLLLAKIKCCLFHYFAFPHSSSSSSSVPICANIVCEHLQDYYKRDGIINVPPSVSVAELHEACDYFLIPFDSTVIKSHNLRKSFPSLTLLAHLCPLYPSLTFSNDFFLAQADYCMK